LKAQQGRIESGKKGAKCTDQGHIEKRRPRPAQAAVLHEIGLISYTPGAQGQAD